ncbi:hyaluronoglucosaminidase [Kitasatospora azatica]|uniref:hyaluronoglucosaminidase n=1 Tax=Kitasatospora azatica TaxID=58347 RepID=UPI001E5FB810|nr:hyaluronoglucosaminidase [Kitasatospora azatica]
MTVALEGATPASADTTTTTFPGPVTAEKFYTNASAESAYFKTASTTDHAVTVYQAATSGSGAALNVVSSNPGTSAMYLSGTETGRGTLKIAHVGYADGSDLNAAALSIDLQTAGTAAQGIYLTTTSGAPTKGNLIAVRNNANLDDFIVKGSGLIGVGIDRASTPRAQVHIKQQSSAPAGLLVEGVVRVGNAATVPTSVDATAGGGALYAQGGALMWRGSNGTVTQIAQA